MIGLGVMGFIIRRPFVFSLFPMLMIFAALIPISILVIFFFNFPGDSDFNSITHIFMLVYLAYILFLIFMMLYQLLNYAVLGSNDETLRNALTYALEKLNLPYQETVSKIRLTGLNADLQVMNISWIGSANIRIKQFKHFRSIRDISAAMNEYYKMTPVRVSYRGFIFYIFGGMMTVMPVVFWILVLYFLSQDLMGHFPGLIP